MPPRPPNPSPRCALRLASAMAFGLAALGSTAARAQACCAGSGAYQPARLKIHEDALVGLQLTADDALGSLTSTGSYAANPAGTAEVDLQESLVGTLRVSDPLQLGVALPFVETYRASSPLTDFGGGLGDITTSGRYDFIYAGESQHLPGLALTAGLTFPTGRTPEEASGPLLANATGAGSWQGGLGGSVEEAFGTSWIASLNGQAELSSTRSVGSIREQLGPTFLGLVALGYFQGEKALALALSTTQSLDATINGSKAPGTSRGWTTLSVTGGMPIADTWRIQAAVNYDLPGLGTNHIAGLGATFTLLKVWM